MQIITTAKTKDDLATAGRSIFGTTHPDAFTGPSMTGRCRVQELSKKGVSTQKSWTTEYDHKDGTDVEPERLEGHAPLR